MIFFDRAAEASERGWSYEPQELDSKVWPPCESAELQCQPRGLLLRHFLHTT